jgi:hypothetical protein
MQEKKRGEIGAASHPHAANIMRKRHFNLQCRKRKGVGMGAASCPHAASIMRKAHFTVTVQDV